MRFGLTIVLALFVCATAFAQRGGYGGGNRGYSGNPPYDGRFQFVRMSYPWSQGRQAAWAHDYPDGEYNLLKIMRDVTNIPLHVSESSIMSYSDPEMFKNTVIYQCEPGFWYLTDVEVKNLRAYLEKGGFLILDDFPRGAWNNVEQVMSQVFPELNFIDLDIKHPIFHSFFEIQTLDLPVVYAQIGGKPIFRALFAGNDKNKRMLVMANYQNDISEYWEWSADTWKPIAENNVAFEFGINEFIYGITH
jgi:hypothetical protein